MFRAGHIQFKSPLILVVRNLRQRWVRTILTALGIVVGVAAMVAVNAANRSTLISINEFFDEASGKSDLTVDAAVNGQRFDQDILEDVRRMDGVAAAVPAVVGVALPQDEMENWEQQLTVGALPVPGSSFWLMGRNILEDQQVYDYSLQAGRLLLPDESSYSMLLVDEYAEEKGVELGEDFSIAIPGTGEVSLRVVGLISKEGIGVANQGVLGIVPLSVAQELLSAAGEITLIDILAEPSVSSNTTALEDLRQTLAQRLGDEYNVSYPLSRGSLVVDSLHSYQQGLDFFGAVSLFVGSFLIYNAFAMTVVERTRENGMLRSIGTTKGQIMAMVIFEALLLGIFGSALGVGTGILMAKGLVKSVAALTGQPIQQISTAPQDLLQSLLIGIAVTLAAAAIPALQASRTSPLQALQVQARSDGKRWVALGWKFGPLLVLLSYLIFYKVPMRPGMMFLVGSNTIFVMMLGATLCIPLVTGGLERVVRPAILLLFGNEGRLGSGNVNRSSGRTTLTVASLMVGISMVVGIKGLTDSFEKDMDAWVDTALGGDLLVRSPMAMNTDLEPRLRAIEGVDAVTRIRYAASNMILPGGEDEYTLFTAIDPATFLAVNGMRIQEGPDQGTVIARLAAGDALVISANVAIKQDISVGDIVTLETKRGRKGFEVVAIIIDFVGGESTSVTGSWRDLQRYFGIRDVSTFVVKLSPGSSAVAVTDIIENEVGRTKSLTVESKQEFEQRIAELSAQAFSLFDVLALIGLVVAALGVINTMLMNVMERTRELGGLRSLGMEQGQVRRMIMAEAATIGFIGGILGASFGAMLADVFVIGLRSMGGFVLVSQFPYQAMAFSFAAAFAVALTAAWYPAVRASKVNIIDAIKHE